MYFNCVGKIFPVKDGGKLKQSDIKIFDSGWAQKTLSFRVKFGSSSALMQLKYGYFANKDGSIKPKDNVIYTYLNDGTGKYVSSKIDYADREDKTIIDNVPSGRKYVLDLANINPYLIEGMYNKFTRGQDVRQEDMDKYNVHSAEQAKNLLEKIRRKKHEYIYVGDFYDDLEMLLFDDNISKKKFRIHGEYEIRYSEQKQTFYKTFVPKKIYMIPEDQQESAEEKMELNFDFFFGKDGFDSTDFDTTGKCYLSGFTRYYDNQFKNDLCKGNVACPITVVVNSQDSKYIEAMRKKFTNFGNCQYKCMKLLCSYIDGADKKEITLEDLTEETRSDIACGLLDFEEVKRQFGGSTYGEKVNEIRYGSYDAVFGVQETEYKESDFDLPTHDVKENVKRVLSGIPSSSPLVTAEDDDDVPFDI